MTKLSVNINKIATLRNSRGGNNPDVVKTAIDVQRFGASINSNELRYINHSCDPNTYMRRAYRKVEFYTLRPVKKGEELTCDYGETHHDGKLPCKCKTANCRGFI